MTHYRRNNIPAFGSWDCNDDLPFTQCFESATQPGFIRSCTQDLYVAGDLYQNNIVTPAIIVAPRRIRGYTKEAKKEPDCGEKKKEPPPPPPPAGSRHVNPKAVDEDLYKISPELLRANPKRRRWGLFSSCMLPACVL
ncbi:hypothetical protein L6452_02572 [Arctium lappa]|uniref:Uncharacterized protein n=1 Tax=Arctium lappa TaxID=4217 RepID=A0ACB9FKU2_ARCLA|nr:hypothetical protein L6452_02572 [Arctium lappa]